MERMSLIGFVTALSLAGCSQPFEVLEASHRGALGEVEGFDRADPTPTARHDWDRSTVELTTAGPEGRVMTRVVVRGGLEDLVDEREVRLLGCSGLEQIYTFDRWASRATARAEPTDDPMVRRVVYVGEWDTDEGVHRVEGSFLYPLPEGVAY